MTAGMPDRATGWVAVQLALDLVDVGGYVISLGSAVRLVGSSTVFVVRWPVTDIVVGAASVLGLVVA